MLQIRPTHIEDIPALLHLFDAARAMMAKAGNPTQWPPHYPNADVVQEDMARDGSYVILDEAGEIVGTFALLLGEDPTYAVIDGAWPNDEPYGTIHRIAVHPNAQNRGIARWAIGCAEKMLLAQGIYHMRIDTHKDNLPLQRSVEALGFVHCGTIFSIHNKSPRVAFHKTLVSL